MWRGKEREREGERDRGDERCRVTGRIARVVWWWGVYPDAWTCVIEHKQTENTAAAIVWAAEEKP